MSDNRTVPVSLTESTAANRSYDIVIGDGLITQAGILIKPLLQRPRVVIVSDETVADFYAAPLREALQTEHIASELITLPPGEQTKSFSQLEALCEALISHGVERRDIIIALGGGVIGDLVGFAAAILRRGCRFIQIPTTLLAQVDSSVGGKTAINSGQGKNLIGAFYQPELVIADTGALSTLSRRQLLAGYAEVVKYGLLGDAEFFSWLEINGEKLLAGDAALRAEAVERSVAAKALIVEQDEREGGIRALLNLGHTFGHAFEAATGYTDRLFHGEAVALGMVCAFDYSAYRHICSPEDAERARNHLAAAGLPTKLSDVEGLAKIPAQELLNHMYQDKKVEAGKLTFILAKSIGAAYIEKDVAPDTILNFLETLK